MLSSAAGSCEHSSIRLRVLRSPVESRPRADVPALELITSGVARAFFLCTRSGLHALRCHQPTDSGRSGVVTVHGTMVLRRTAGGQNGSHLASVSIAAYFSLNVLLGEGTPVESISVAIAGGAGFTAGAAGICAWIWARGRTGLATGD